MDALNTLRDVPVNPIPVTVNPELPDPNDPAVTYEWGLYQGEILANQMGQAYRAALNQHLLPRLLLRLEEQIQGSMQEPELLYEALKVYLMLGLEGPMDASIVRSGWRWTGPLPIRARIGLNCGPTFCSISTRCCRSRWSRSRSTARWSRRHKESCRNFALAERFIRASSTAPMRSHLKNGS